MNRLRRAIPALLFPLLVAVLLAPPPTGAAPPAASAAEPPPAWKAALAQSQAAIGRDVPDLRLKDRSGRTVKLSDYRGKPLVVSFVYTGCFSACPVGTQYLAKAVRSARQGLGAESFRVVSIGFNQPADTPEAMAAFARQNRIADPEWEFLSPDPKEADALMKAFGFSATPTSGGFDHIAQVSVVDADGRIAAQVYGTDFELPLLVTPLKALLAGEAGRRFTLADVWTKVKLYCTVYDPTSDRYRLNYSLFFELFAGFTVLGAVAWFVVREWARSRPGRLPLMGIKEARQATGDHRRV